MKFKIVADSSCDLSNEYIIDDNVGFEIVPLSINIDQNCFIDNDSLNIDEMLLCMKNSKSAAKTSCPSLFFFTNSYEEADYVFVVTISSKLSGTYNSAYLGAIESNNKVHVIDSKGTSGMMIFIIDKLYELIKSGLEFEKIIDEIERYQKSLNLLFVLDKFDNLVKNGRMSKLTAIAATALFIKPLCIAKDGQISIHEKPKTMKASLIRLVNNIGNLCDDFSNKCYITHCKNLENANKVKKMILEKYSFKDVVILEMKGLCSFYALENGIIVSF